LRPLGSLRTQIAAAMALLAIAVLAAMALIMYLGAQRLLSAELDRHLHRDIEAAMHALSRRAEGEGYDWRETPHPEDDPFDTEPAVELWRPGPPPQRVYRRDAQGPAATLRPTEATPPPAAAGYRSWDGPGGRWREAVEMRTVAGDTRALWVRTLRSEEPLRAELAALALKIGIGALAGALLCALLAGAWVGRALAPLNALARRMRRVNTRPLAAGVEGAAGATTGEAGTAAAVDAVPSDAAEVAALAREFDAMLLRLDRSHHELERFAADCAHALRTPLTALRLRGERQGHALPEGPGREAVAGMLEEADRMSVLIQRLLLLARASGSGAEATGPVPLAGLLAEVFDTLAPLAEQRGIRLCLDDAPALDDVVARADAGWLRQVLQDLVHNALEHAGGSGRSVHGRVGREGGLAAIELHDEGPGVPAAVLARLGLPAWRGAAAAPRDRASGGTGLGLAIAARLLAIRGGRLELLGSPKGGTCARCLLPLASEGVAGN
jgi:signal transduction histidine kinase